MSEKGSYLLELGCTNHSCEERGEYEAQTAGECRRDARVEGWVIIITRNLHLCPTCAVPYRKKRGRPPVPGSTAGR
jgi:hypothetical protein